MKCHERFFIEKKGKIVFSWLPYGRFLNISTIMAPTMAIATIIAATPAAMYISVGGKLATGYGDAVGDASPMVM